MSNKHPADPSPQSVVAVGNSGAYKCVYEAQCLSIARQSAGRIETVFRHKETDTYWSTGYEVRLDDSDAELPAHWQQVRPREVVTVVFDPV